MEWSLHEKEWFIPTPEEMKRSNEFLKKCLKLGIRIDRLTEKSEFTKDEIDAMHYIIDEKNVPEEIVDRLIKVKNRRDSEQSRIEVDPKMYDSEIEKIIGHSLE